METQEAHDLSPGEQALSRVDEQVFKVESLFNFAAGMVIFLVMIIGVVQVVGRSFFNMPVPSYVDIIEIIMSIFAFIGIAYCQRLGGHVRMEIILKMFKGRVFWIAETFGTVVAMTIIVILTYYGFEHFWRAYTIGDSTIDGDFILWPSKLLVPVAFILLLVRLSINLVGFVRLVARPDAVPIGIPVIESVDDQAQYEIHMSGADQDVEGLSTAEERGGN